REIENIVEFLKNGKKYEYDADIIESIEREAARCGEKKKGRGSADSDGDFDGEDRDSIMSSDDAILPAIEIAVDSGSVSTSLLQRKLSLGYARAARIVDKLEKLGVVGPFEGSKPRKVLITREEFLEMRMNFEGSDE
ncbi:MAG: DNA translocase FtsK, partial [Clostridia bacterium]|nr:DNA translocase FtsK [Clostridia bacterium]